jgi:hypothetical protein
MPSSHPSTTAVPALEQARTNYDLALAYDPATAGWPGLHLGRLLYMSGDLPAAGAAFRASVASGDVAYAPVASYHLGRLHEDLGNTVRGRHRGRARRVRARRRHEEHVVRASQRRSAADAGVIARRGRPGAGHDRRGE